MPLVGEASRAEAQQTQFRPGTCQISHLSADMAREFAPGGNFLAPFATGMPDSQRSTGTGPYAWAEELSGGAASVGSCVGGSNFGAVGSS